jgi:hypothetical protein
MGNRFFAVDLLSWFIGRDRRLSGVNQYAQFFRLWHLRAALAESREIDNPYRFSKNLSVRV